MTHFFIHARSEREVVVIVEVDGEAWALTHEVVSGLGLELLDIELSGKRNQRVVRVYIEKSGGVFISDCVVVSRALGERFDKENLFEGSYRLEVSSPGVERPLRRIRDFERHVGRRVRMRLKGKQKEQRKILGKIVGVEAGEGIVHVLLMNGLKASFSLSDIAKANLDVDWDAEFQAPGNAE